MLKNSRKVLHLRDKNNKLLALVATNLLELLPHLETTIMHQLASIMAGEIYTDKSNRLGYSFLAWHCSYYNRYAEKVCLLTPACFVRA
jgi:hypothetical protein